MSNSMSIKSKQPNEGNYVVHPKKFALWLFLISITMLFGAFTSAMIVRRADGNWQPFLIPLAFKITTILAILSSGSMQFAYFSAKKDNIYNLRIALLITFLLGLGFVYGQWIGFEQLYKEGVFLSNNSASGSFFYVIVGAHALHIVGGIIFLLFAILSAFKWKIHSKNLLRINLCTTYWHFIGLLWLYLFAILNYFVK